MIIIDNTHKININYRCEDLIEEVKHNIAEFGKDKPVIVFCKNPK